MLTSWRDQDDFIKGRCWDSPILVVITRLILGKISIVPNKSGHGAYNFDTGGEGMSIKYGPIFFKTRVSKSEVGQV